MGTQTLNSYLNHGITLTATGADTPPFTITAAGTLKATQPIDLQATVPAYISNAGLITGATVFGVDLAAGGTLANTGTIFAGGAGHRDGVGIFNPGTITNAGEITGLVAGIYADYKSITMLNAGLISGGSYAIFIPGGVSGDRVVAESGAVFVGAVKAASAGNTLEFSGTGASFANIGTEFVGFSTLAFDPGAAWTISGNTMALGTTLAITGFNHQSAIDLTHFAATSETFAANALTLSNGASTDILDITGAFSSASFVLGSDHAGGTVIDVTCFCAGTRILTPAGETPVENLEAGDLVITAAGEIRPIIWTGREEICIAEHPEPELVRPIRITAGALGGGLPERDLRLSPHHAVLMKGTLVEAISLVNHTTIFQEQTCTQVTYHHIELESHDILLAEGCPCESFLDTGTRLATPQNRSEPKVPATMRVQ